MEFDHSFLSVTSVVLNVDQFFGFSDGLLKQQKQDNHIFQKNVTILHLSGIDGED